MVLHLLSRQRPRWRHKHQFFLFCAILVNSPVSFCILPVKWMQGGGVLFLIPVAVFILTVGAPLVLLEMSLGQFMQARGPLSWAVVPMFKGLAVTSMLVTILKTSCNLVLGSWSIQWLVLALSGQLNECNNKQTGEPIVSTGASNESLISERHHPRSARDLTERWPPQLTDSQLTVVYMAPSVEQSQELSHNVTSDKFLAGNLSCLNKLSEIWGQTATSPTQTSHGLMAAAYLLPLVLSLFCFILVAKDIRWSPKGLYLLAPIPLVGILVMAGLMASRGDHLQFKWPQQLSPDWTKLALPETWLSGLEGTLLLLGTGLNAYPCLASYNKYSNHTVRDTWLVVIFATLTNVVTSIFVAALTEESPNSWDPVNAESTFITRLLTAASMTPNYGGLFSFVFCVVLASVVIGTNVVYMESLLTSVIDLLLPLRRWRWLLAAGISTGCLLLTVSVTSQGDHQVFHLLDQVTNNGFLVTVICWLQCLVIGVVYGGKRFYDNLQSMTGRKPHWWFKFCWTFLSPFILLSSLVYKERALRSYFFTPFQDANTNNLDLLLPVLLTIILTPIPLVAAWIICNTNGGIVKKLRSAVKPDLKPYQVPIKWRLEGHWVKFTNQL